MASRAREPIDPATAAPAVTGVVVGLAEVLTLLALVVLVVM
jgi:hypothetical protein